LRHALGGSSDDKSSTSPCDGKQVAAKAAPHDLASRESLPNREARRRSLGHDKEDILQVSEIFQEEDQMPQSGKDCLAGKHVHLRYVVL
jgi:hypothetical protein